MTALAVLFGLGACGSGASVTPAPEVATRASAPSTNGIVRYLRGAELQAEDQEQIANIHRAFEDLATLPVTELRARRYSDYQGTPDTWDLPRVLRSHFVPIAPESAGIIDAADDFWVAADSEEVRALAREMLDALEQAVPPNPPTP